MTIKKILILGALPSSLINFRGELIRKLIHNGYKVTAMAQSSKNESEVIAAVETLGAQYIPYPVSRSGLNPFADLVTFWTLKKIFERVKPDLILAYTIKPIIWGGIAARFFSDARFYGLMTGLGFAFQSGGFKRKILTSIVKKLYQSALFNSPAVIFQNPDNLNTFVENKIVKRNKAFRVHGSGVQLTHFHRTDLSDEAPVFLTIARLLGEKGLREYAIAGEKVKAIYPNVTFRIVGPEDPSPDGIPIEEVKKWQQRGYIDYLGGANDVRPFIKDCHIFVLASYHEGMPRTVLEAMAMGRPILTTNVPGCKETVIEGSNGFLVDKASAEQLANRMIWFIENREAWQSMADKSHQLAQERYDVCKVNNELFDIMKLNRSDVKGSDNV